MRLLLAEDEEELSEALAQELGTPEARRDLTVGGVGLSLSF